MHLSVSQAGRLYRLLDALTVYINRTRKVIDPSALYDPMTGSVTDYARSEILPMAWDVPEIIDEFAERNPAGLSSNDRAEMRRWKNHVTGPALVLDYDPDGRALVALGDDVVAVTGITRDMPAVIDRPAPAFIWLTMLPFEDVVTYDTIVRLYDLSIGPGARQMIETELKALGGKRRIECADEFVAAAQADRQRRCVEQLEQLERDIEHERIEAGGAEELPSCVHRGILAGLSEEDRARAVERALQDTMSNDASEVLARVQAVAERCAPRTRLEDVLALDNKVVLEQDARRMGIKYASKMRKAELAHMLAEASNADGNSIAELRNYLMGCYEVEFTSFRKVLAQPQGAYTFDETDVTDHADIAPYRPYLCLFESNGTFTAVIPDEYREAASRIDLDQIAAQRAHERKIANVGEALCEFCGVVSISDVAARCAEVCGFEPTDEEVLDALYAAVERDESYAPFAFWRPIDQDASAFNSRRGKVSKTYSVQEGLATPADYPAAASASWFLVHSTVGDQAVAKAVSQRVADELSQAEGGGMPTVGQEALADQLLDRDELRKRLFRELDARDAYLIDLLDRHREKEPMGLCPLAPELAEEDVLEWEAKLPEAVNLRNWLDAHVPDGADDCLFADDTIAGLIMAYRVSGDPQAVIEEASDLGLFVLSEDTQAIFGRLMLFINALPRWENNGWSPIAVREAEVGHRIFYNPDGSEMHPERNDPCPCGSGKKYKKCCGR